VCAHVCMYVYATTQVIIYDLSGSNLSNCCLYPLIQTVNSSKPSRDGADTSLARPGRKQATATKLGIYSTNSLRSSIHFLARCSNVCKQLKNFRILSVHPGLRGSNELRFGRNMVTFLLFFNPEKRW